MPARRLAPRVADAVSAKHASDADVLKLALGAVLEGVAFYEFAQILSADTRGKVTFADLGPRKASQPPRLTAPPRPDPDPASPPRTA